MNKVERRPTTLDQRIGQALDGKVVAADDLQHLIGEVEAAIEGADKIAKQERERSLDPMASPADAEQAAQRAVVVELKRDRLKTALPRLQEKHSEARRIESADRWHAIANKVEIAVDAVVEQLAHYRQWADQIVAVLREAEATNEQVARINGVVPDGIDRRVGKVDLAWAQNLVLPDPGRPDHNLWPPPRPSFAESYAASMAVAPHPGADWARAQAANADTIRERQRRQGEYYENLTREQEERQNREERERFSRRQP